MAVEQTKLAFVLTYIVWIFASFKLDWVIPGARAIAPTVTVIHGVLFLLWIVSSRTKFEEPMTRYFMLFLLLMVVSSLFARNNGLSRLGIKSVFLFLITYLATITFADDQKKVFSVFKIFILGHVVIALLSIAGGGQVKQIAIFADENDLALGINTVLPIALSLGMGEKELKKKIYYLCLTGVFCAANIISFSRGGFVGMIAAVMFVWVKSWKGKAKATVLIMGLACGMLLFAPAAFWDEMRTIKDGTADATGGGRVFMWKVAVREFLDNPVMGVGVMNYGVWLPEYVRDDDVMSDGTEPQGITTRYGRVCHSLYFTVLSELGLIGVVLFGMMLYSFFKSMRFVIGSNKDLVEEEQARTSPQDLETGNKCRLLGLGLSGSMIGFLVSAAFLSVLYYPQFWLMCSLGISLKKCKLLSIVAQKA